MRHEIKFIFGDNTSTVIFDGNSVVMNSELAILIYNYLISGIVEESAKTIEKSISEFVHLIPPYKAVVRLNRKEDGDITEASIIIDELSEEDRKILEQGEE